MLKVAFNLGFPQANRQIKCRNEKVRGESYPTQSFSTQLAFSERADSMTASSSVLGAASSAPTSFLSPDTPVHFGIVGCGWFGRVHVERLSEIPNVRVVAVCDPEQSAALKLAEQVPASLRPTEGVAVYTDVNSLLSHPGLHAVSINSPNRWHVPQILAALQQGLHVLCEKPLTLVRDEVTQVVAAAQEAERIVAVAYQSRYRRDARLLRMALQSGKWGRVTSVSVFACEDWVTPNVGNMAARPGALSGRLFRRRQWASTRCSVLDDAVGTDAGKSHDGKSWYAGSHRDVG